MISVAMMPASKRSWLLERLLREPMFIAGDSDSGCFDLFSSQLENAKIAIITKETTGSNEICPIVE
jgi:hypothetical protein